MSPASWVAAVCVCVGGGEQVQEAEAALMAVLRNTDKASPAPNPPWPPACTHFFEKEAGEQVMSGLPYSLAEA